MNQEQKLAILKKDLQQTTKANDELLLNLLELGAAAVKREGIVLSDGDIESDFAVIHYAAYLFRKRAAPDASMPRMLRWELNQLLFAQKGKTNDIR